MKINVEVDCTPEEARRVMGLPDLTPVHDKYVAAMGDAMDGKAQPEMIENDDEELGADGRSADGLLATDVRRRRPTAERPMDTIFAVSSGAPPAAIAVVRISGPAAFERCGGARRRLAAAAPGGASHAARSDRSACCSIARWCWSSPARTARPARIWSNFICTAAGRWSRAVEAALARQCRAARGRARRIHPARADRRAGSI